MLFDCWILFNTCVKGQLHGRCTECIKWHVNVQYVMAPSRTLWTTESMSKKQCQWSKEDEKTILVAFLIFLLFFLHDVMLRFLLEKINEIHKIIFLSKNINLHVIYHLKHRLREKHNCSQMETPSLYFTNVYPLHIKPGNKYN